MNKNKLFYIVIGCCLATFGLMAQRSINRSGLDVINYHVLLEPNISEGSITGNVEVRFIVKNNRKEIAFDCGNLIIDTVIGKEVEGFRQENRVLAINLSKEEKPEYFVEIKFHGNPKRGINFYPDINQVYTVFHTSGWMVCNNEIEDRASVSMDLIVPNALNCIANGTLKEKKEIDEGRVMYSWGHDLEIPTYTFGFVIGAFNSFTYKGGDISMQYFSPNHSPEELKTIFKETPNMFRFFEKKSGIPYCQNNYCQILCQGQVSQEMSGFAVIRNSYGAQVLEDETQLNLSAHELAHQWWGNMVTCRGWNHFWLNEGMAVYMSSAYKEHRFGRNNYLKDIDAYYAAYKKVKDQGLDKPLVFNDWSNPTSADRTIVYYKGAYVIHLLREELGDDVFWEGIKNYTQLNFGKSVVTKDFQDAMEKAAKKGLDNFFNKWIYQN